jgi:hypothetical protein
VAVVVSIGLLAGACTPREPQHRDPDLSIDLRWIKGYPRERRAHVETGLLWTLSFLGAGLPADGPDVLRWEGSVVTVDLDAAEVIESTKPRWKELLATLKASDEYRVMGAIDVGRFVMLTLASPNHYYRLAGASATFDEFRARYRFDAKRVAVVESGIAHGHRLVEIAAGATFGEIAFVAYEGRGSLVDGSFEPAEIETLSLMDNGQLRFALYDLDGKPKAAATAALTDAGKPSKCLWCHELGLHTPFENVTDVAGYYSTREFVALIQARMATLNSARREIESRVDFAKTQDHTLAELLYLSFAEPSLARLAGEWNVSIEEARSRLRGKDTHRHEEFDFLGDQLYRRDEIDELAPYTTIRTPSDAREPSSYEPDLLK